MYSLGDSPLLRQERYSGSKPPPRRKGVIRAGKAHGKLLSERDEFYWARNRIVLAGHRISRLDHFLYVRDEVVRITPLREQPLAIRHYSRERTNLLVEWSVRLSGLGDPPLLVNTAKRRRRIGVRRLRRGRGPRRDFYVGLQGDLP